jgi:hypothetical protein
MQVSRPKSLISSLTDSQIIQKSIIPYICNLAIIKWQRYSKYFFIP